MSNVFQCGNAWQIVGDPEAGWELLRHLRSPEIDVRTLAEEFLVKAGPRPIKLLPRRSLPEHGTGDCRSIAGYRYDTMWWSGCDDINPTSFPYDS